MGDGNFGVRRLRWQYFGKHASKLTKSEAALIAAVCPIPDVSTLPSSGLCIETAGRIMAMIAQIDSVYFEHWEFPFPTHKTTVAMPRQNRIFWIGADGICRCVEKAGRIVTLLLQQQKIRFSPPLCCFLPLFPVYTLGRKTDMKKIYCSTGFSCKLRRKIFPHNRGGDITFLGRDRWLAIFFLTLKIAMGLKFLFQPRRSHPRTRTYG
jgi:hypothetical protein